MNQEYDILREADIIYKGYDPHLRCDRTAYEYGLPPTTLEERSAAQEYVASRFRQMTTWAIEAYWNTYVTNEELASLREDEYERRALYWQRDREKRTLLRPSERTDHLLRPASSVPSILSRLLQPLRAE